MKRASHQQANAIFLGACELAPADIPAFVEAQCGEDSELAQHVFALLSADARTDDFLESPLLFADGEAPESIAGERAYRLLRRLGTGGMGEVHLAERSDGEFRQKVAIKLMHGDHRLRRDALLRFKAERQILASLNHPNVARLLDGGTLASGAPFLVMEYVEGTRLDEWCQQRELVVRDRLALFLKICDAVQVAHQSLIVHRDLKPSNILVTDTGEPKLLDFGIAKVLNAEWFAHSMAHTGTGRSPMTLAYASPEQVRGQAVGTASDVYALGVLLYEMLTGSLPYRVAPSDPVSLARAVCEDEPDPPSRNTTRGHVIHASADAPATSRPPGFAAQTLSRRQLRGDLDAIVLKALRKEPGARYGSVEQMAADIRRYLDGLPVLARRGSAAYRARKFVSRHRWPIAAGSILFATLLASVVLLRAELARTEIERDKAEQVARFFVAMFDRSDPLHEQVLDSVEATSITVREVMDASAPRIARELAGSPEVQAQLLSVVARVYNSLGLPESSRQYGEAALAMLERAGRIPSRASVETRLFLLEALNAGNRYEAALAQADLALEEVGALASGDDFDRARALRGRGSTLRNLGRWQLAESDTIAALAMFKRVRGPNDPYVAGTLKDLAIIAAGTGDFARCDRLGREVADLLSASSASTLSLVSIRTTRATCLTGLGDLATAETLLRENLAAQSRSLGSNSVSVGKSKNDLADLLNQQRRFAEAEQLLREALATLRAGLGERHEALTPVLLNLSTSVFEQGRQEEGIELQTQAVELAPRSQRKQYAVALNNLGYKLYQVDRKVESEARFREALAIFDEVARDHPDRAMTLSSLGRLLVESRRAKEAQPLIEAGLEIRLAVLPADHWAISDSRSLLGACLAAQGRRAEAEPLLRQGLAGLQATMGADHPRTVRARARLDAHLAQPPADGQVERARPR